MHSAAMICSPCRKICTSLGHIGMHQQWHRKSYRLQFSLSRFCQALCCVKGFGTHRFCSSSTNFPDVGACFGRYDLIPMASSLAVVSLWTLGGNGFLLWPARATCKTLQAEALAAGVLRKKLMIASAKARSQVKILLKPETAAYLAESFEHICLSTPYQSMGILPLLC